MLRFFLLAVSLFGLLFSSPVWAEKPGPSYDALRAELIQKGYRPLKLAHGDTSYFCLGGFCDAYPETIYCTAAGPHYCGMGFGRPDGKGFLIVDTLGEVVYKLLVVRQRAPHPDELCAIRQNRYPCDNYDPGQYMKRK